MTRPPPASITWEEYQIMDTASDVGLEWVSGQVFPRDPSTADHCRINTSVGAELREALKDSPYECFMIGMRLRIKQESDELAYYPDVMVLDDDPTDVDPCYCTSPRILFEVLSPTSRRIDKHEKLLAYRSIRSLQVYVMLEQSCKRAFIHRRSNDWWPEIIEGDNGILTLDEIGVCLGFADIYARVEFAL